MNTSWKQSIEIAGNTGAIAGFTLLEMLTVMLMAGILAAIAAPSFALFLANQQVSAARSELHSAILQAQQAATKERVAWRFSLRERNGHLEWATHADSVSASQVTAWNALPDTIRLDDPDTTLAESGGIHYVKFNFRGEVAYRLSTVTVDHQNAKARNKCVIISTLIGATRQGEEHAQKKNDRYCY